MLGVAWGKPRTVRGKSGSFHELWLLAWEPEFELRLIEANVWGATLELACESKLRHQAQQTAHLPELTGLVEKMLLADARRAVPALMARMQELAASTHDAGVLLAALAPLANVLRYGSVRGTDTASVGEVMDGLVQRACIALPLAARGINEEAAQVLLGQVIQAGQAITLLQNDSHKAAWNEALEQCVRVNAHPLIAGRAARILFEHEAWNVEQCAQALSLACTNPVNPIATAEWLEGFLRGSGLLLLVNDALWNILDSWMSGLPEEAFTELLPLLRRTFATFDAPERRQLGERVVSGTATLSAPVATGGIDEERAALVLPVLALLFAAPEAQDKETI